MLQPPPNLAHLRFKTLVISWTILTQIKAQTNTPINLFLRVDVGDGKTKSNAQTTKNINAIFKPCRVLSI